MEDFSVPATSPCFGNECFLWICRQLRRLNLIGELPDEFADFPYLQEIDLNHNYLSGSVPKAWKTLPLVNLAMLANTIGGSIPKEIAEIVTLQHLVLTDNQLEGPLPPELGKLTSLTQLALSGNNFTGVLPATFANLKNMADFRIAGTSISGKIPDFIGDWTQLIELDIRGTSMEGPIPSTIFHLKNLTKLRVSDLRGPETPFPDFQDVSVMSQLELRNCLIRGSIPSNIGEMIPRLIRLGGSEVAIGDEKYDADVSPMGPSSFHSYNDKWACSTTGDFIVPLPEGKANYLTQASPNMTVAELYKTARISPLSLKYYGICLRPGNYKGKRYLKAFNIEEEAKGVGRSITKEYDVDVTSSTLEIHLYWAGKGTIFIPSDFAYGPLISAIAVTPNFGPDTSHVSVGVIAGIVAASFVLIVLVLAILWKKGYLGKKDLEDKAELGELLQTSYFTLREVKAATRNFDRANKIGEGGFGPVYKGLRPDDSSFFINCGGSEMAIGDEKYDADVSPMGPSSFYSYNDKWACSTTGDFIVPLLKGKPNYLAQASPNITVKDLYMTARISPLSLKYHGICLRPGNYKVKLHFAEIMFPIDKIASGIGTRIFDVSIQGKRYLKDFNIEEEAKGVGKSIVKEYDVDVTSSTLEIHLYWAGKGTIFIPSDFAYGPLISAIAVTPNFVPDTGHISVGVIAGIVAASFVLIILILSILWKKGYLGKEDPEDKELRDLLRTSYFTLREVKAATKNFDRANKIGEGGFGPVYKGLRPDGSFIAVKQLSAMSKQGNREFVNEIGIISALQHPNLVKLFGCCVEGNQLLVIYEYMENNSLARALYGYMAPEYASSGRLTYKADVYSFGIVALEIVSGKSNTKYMTDDEYFCLLDWANVLNEKGNLLDLIDPILKSNYSKKEVLRMLNIALLCTNRSPALRPMMSTVVGMLKGRLPVLESYVVSSARTDDPMSSASASEGISYDTQIHTSTSSQGSSTLLEMTNSTVEDPWQADSTISTYYSTKKEDVTRGH
ncbi:hypothetical protein C5167_049670 [Papaver somniferum]|uniref:non-specific serine/threonine protein kinase n=1 Tax=Papaver somniferum TaxID=3469 RepID=A0A4Y7KQM3_PAPSO|nr:hypothetical protein C5167_049670 [Papaver somniferum]